MASAAFLQARDEITEEGASFTLFMSRVYETVNEQGHLISVREREIDACNENGFLYNEDGV
jgi:hypothetical protein